MPSQYHVYMISDGTGITVESFGNSLLTQFEHLEFTKTTIPYIDTVDKAKTLAQRINEAYHQTHIKPLVFMTMVNPEIAKPLAEAQADVFDLFNPFLIPLQKLLKTKLSHRIGQTHRVADSHTYNHRIEAINFALAHDDGLKPSGYNKAEIILIGVSRSGKTPSCLYMALQFGVFAANYPLTDDDLSYSRIPESIKAYKHKLFGLTINAERLKQIRTERRPNSRYASLEQCKHEVSEVETMFQSERIPYLDSTAYSIEEIVTHSMDVMNIKRKF